ncbi:hypothetical protein Droror1_Dr00002712 [Drosera rotundifolia]
MQEPIPRGGVARRLSTPPTPPRRDPASSSSISPSFASTPVPSPFSSSSPSVAGIDDEYTGGYRLGLTLDSDGGLWFHDHSVISYVMESFESCYTGYRHP